MGKVNGVEEATTSNSSVVEPSQQETKNQENETIHKVPFHKLFSFADSTDKALMIIGTIGAIGNGACMPLMTIVFGDVVDAFGENQDPQHTLHVVSKVSVT